MFIRYSNAQGRWRVTAFGGDNLPASYHANESDVFVLAAETAMRPFAEPPQTFTILGPGGYAFVLEQYARGLTIAGDTVQYATAEETDRPALPPVIVTRREKLA